MCVLVQIGYLGVEVRVFGLSERRVVVFVHVFVVLEECFGPGVGLVVVYTNAASRI